MSAPVFNLNASNLGSQEELQKELDKPAFGKNFDKGNYDGIIKSAEFHVGKETKSIYCEGDATWFNVAIVISGADDREARYWLQVPTQKVHFGAKKTLFVYKKFVEFLAAIGQTVTTENLGTVVPKYFTDPSKLQGLKLNFDIGYEGPHAEKGEDGLYRIMKGGKAVCDDEGNVIEAHDLNAVKVLASNLEPKVALSYPSILKFNPGKKAPKADKPADTDW